jgi:murein DD-endopeptidase MepM/ murein hydrolase activator NlpD
MRLAPDTDSLRRVRNRRRNRSVLATLTLAGALLAGLGALRSGPSPEVEIRPERPGIGRSTTVTFAARAGRRGVSRLHAEIVQSGRSVDLADRSEPTPPGWAFWRSGGAELAVSVPVGKQHQEGLVEGPATLRVTAFPAPAWLRRGTPTVRELELPVRLSPPAIEIVSTQHYVAQGGSEVVRYRVGAASVRDGVEVGDRFFPGAQLPGALAGERFALFAVPYDVGDAGSVRLVAEDDVGNRRESSFVDRFTPIPPGDDDIRLDDRFLDKVVPEILAATPDARDEGSALANYLWINRELRRRNNTELAALATKSEPAFLWRSTFLALPGGQVMSSFADRRTYLYDGKEVDRQDHLGFDLASIAKAEVPAGNDGVVLLAKYLGIYGNAVVVDHGFGLMTLYAHLSSLAVSEGDRVKRGQSLGRSGATGLAAGDHLHFSFLLQGLPVRPVEWWDAHWIEDRLKRKLGAALPFGG